MVLSQLLKEGGCPEVIPLVAALIQLMNLKGLILGLLPSDVTGCIVGPGFYGTGQVDKGFLFSLNGRRFMEERERFLRTLPTIAFFEGGGSGFDIAPHGFKGFIGQTRLYYRRGQNPH
jgi:hypothetical protein